MKTPTYDYIHPIHHKTLITADKLKDLIEIQPFMHSILKYVVFCLPMKTVRSSDVARVKMKTKCQQCLLDIPSHSEICCVLSPNEDC